MAYTGIDKEIYDSGVHFRPLQKYTQQQWTPPAIMGQNTNAGITNTQATGSYMGYPSYEEWLLAQGGGGGGGNDPVDNINRGGINQNLGPTNITDYEAEADDVGPTWGGTWARAQDLYSKLPLPSNLIRRGIMKWRENREIKKEQKRIAEDRTGIGDHDRGTFEGPHPDRPTKTPEQGGWHPGVGGNGGTGNTGGLGTDTPAEPGGWGPGAAQGGRIGMAKGKIPVPKTKSTTSFPLTSALMGIASIFNRRPLMLSKLQGTNPASWGSQAWRANKLANLSKMGKWATRGRLLAPALMNPWLMAPAALGFGAKYAVGKAFDPYRDETGKIGAEGHAQLASAARAREALMAQRNAARENRRDGGLAGLL